MNQLEQNFPAKNGLGSPKSVVSKGKGRFRGI
jgi:hypothetical protein